MRLCAALWDRIRGRGAEIPPTGRQRGTEGARRATGGQGTGHGHRAGQRNGGNAQNTRHGGRGTAPAQPPRLPGGAEPPQHPTAPRRGHSTTPRRRSPHSPPQGRTEGRAGAAGGQDTPPEGKRQLAQKQPLSIVHSYKLKKGGCNGLPHVVQ